MSAADELKARIEQARSRHQEAKGLLSEVEKLVPEENNANLLIGALEAIGDELSDLWNTITTNPVETVKDALEGAKEFVDDPIQAAEEALEEFAEPYMEDWNNGRPLQAFGRGIVEVGQFFIPGWGIYKGIEKGLDFFGGAAGDSDTPKCFVAGTKVLTTQGAKPIESLIIGDEVYAHDPISGERASHRISQTFVRTVPVVLDIKIGKTTITCSPEHPFWVPDISWQKAEKLEPGDSLLTKANHVVRVGSIRRREGSFTVFNVTVEGLNTYFVSDLGILVHNKPMRNPDSSPNPSPADELLANGRQVRGDFPKTAKPNEVLYRADSNGYVKYYQVYGADGVGLKRVDINRNSRPHPPYGSQHVHERLRNTNPETGRTYPGKEKARDIRPEDVPSNVDPEDLKKLQEKWKN